MGMTQESKQKAAKKRVKAGHGRGLKTPPAELAEFIRLANLVPDGEWLPPELLPNLNTVGGTWAELLEKLNDLPEAVQAELVQQSKQVKPTPEELTWSSLEGWRFGEVLGHYEKIRVAYYNLRGLTRDTASLDPLENLLHALLRAELPYLRRCAYEKCGEIFYAGKSIQPGCKPEHSDIIRKKRKRERDNANRHPKKRAKTARKR